MPRFTVLPIDPTYSTIKFTARDAGGVLNVVSQMGCPEADVLKDGRYAFSVRLDGNGVWAIFQRPVVYRGESVPAYG